MFKLRQVCYTTSFMRRIIKHHLTFLIIAFFKYFGHKVLKMTYLSSCDHDRLKCKLVGIKMEDHDNETRLQVFLGGLPSVVQSFPQTLSSSGQSMAVLGLTVVGFSAELESWSDVGAAVCKVYLFGFERFFRFEWGGV